ncbi:Fc receptor-like protein 4 isoform X2 [Anas platyrhynchos]|uniref:Fc receptor-like protein 4 isoform X2 n=1 Tax=Anas platyrhynchos TaxID=8839 RepID=UPI003AF316A4
MGRGLQRDEGKAASWGQHRAGEPRAGLKSISTQGTSGLPSARGKSPSSGPPVWDGGEQSPAPPGMGFRTSKGRLTPLCTAERLADASRWCSPLLFLLSAQVLGLAATETALLTTDPPWSTIFRGESVTLRCRGSQPSGQQPTTWYHNDKILARTDTDTYRITNARQKQTGTYKCQSPGSVASNPITLIVSYDWLILQVPSHAVFEGELLCMQCRGWEPGSVTSVQYFRDGADITTRYASDKQLCIPRAETQQSGRYRCTGQMNSFLSVIKRESQELHVCIRELFSSPVLSVASSAETLEGSPLNLSCVTHLSPHSPRSILWYLFYRNGTVLQGPKTSSKYHVPMVGLADTGSYSCEVRAENSSIWKQSAQVPIAVRRVPISGVSLDVQPHEGQVMEGQRLVLSCSVAAGTGSISFSWHREGSAEVLGRGTRYEIPSAQRDDDGHYYCVASNGGVPAQSPRLRVTVVGVSSLFYCHIRAPLLLAALGSLLSGLLAVHVLMSKDPKGAKQ